jgi:hypothetical protein
MIMGSGAATYPPVLVTDTATFGGLEPDVVFFLNPNNSRIYAFAPIAGISSECLDRPGVHEYLGLQLIMRN